MSGREQLIRDWQDRLAQSEAELECASPHRRWIKRIYVRLFRFLLAVYGQGDWASDETPVSPDGAETADDDAHQSRMELIDLRTDAGGSPPKGAAQIRQTLKTVREAATQGQAGPHVDGLRPEDWIVVASRRDGVALAPFAEALYLAGVPWRRRRLGRDIVLEVHLFHEEEALELLKELGSTVREWRSERRTPSLREVRRVVRVFTGSLLGSLLPITGLVIYRDCGGTASGGDLLIMIIIGVLAGGVCGGIVGWGVDRRRK